MAVAEGKSKLKIKKTMEICGVSLMFLALFLVAVRSFTIDIFDEGRYQSFLAPAGKIMDAEKDSFSFVVASDTGAKNRSIEYIAKKARKSDASFILYLGDLVRYRNPSHFKWITDELAQKLKNFPFYAVPGNHEILTEDGVVDRTLYTSVFGQPYYWFGYGNTLFIGLNSSEGILSQSQLEWLSVILKKIRPQFKYCVIFSHYPPISKDRKINRELDPVSRKKFEEVIRGRDVDLILAGHVHYFWKGEFAGIPLVTVPSSGQPVRSDIDKLGYVKVRIGKDGIFSVKEHYIDVDSDMEFMEVFFSNALVKDEINDISMGLFLFGLVLFVLGNRLKTE